MGLFSWLKGDTTPPDIDWTTVVVDLFEYKCGLSKLGSVPEHL